MTNIKSEALFARGQKIIPGGVNSPVRAFRGVGGTPRFIARGEGSRLIDVDGNSYIDYICSWGPLILGHRPKPVIDALREVLEIGTSFGAPTERELDLGETIRWVAEQPNHVCINEIIISPTWNRIYVGGAELNKR